jgi:hypothetical protein
MAINDWAAICERECVCTHYLSLEHGQPVIDHDLHRLPILKEGHGVDAKLVQFGIRKDIVGDLGLLAQHGDGCGESERNDTVNRRCKKIMGEPATLCSTLLSG